MGVQVKHWLVGTVLAEGETAKEAVENSAKNGANLSGANLRRADLTGANLNWQSHDLFAEILRKAAITIDQYKIAGLILIRRDLCWEQFMDLNDPLTGWAIEELRKHVIDGDDHPKAIDEETRQ